MENKIKNFESESEYRVYVESLQKNTLYEKISNLNDCITILFIILFKVFLICLMNLMIFWAYMNLF